MSLLSQKDRTLTITALEHYRDFLSSEIEFIENQDLVGDTNYPEYDTYKSELYELDTLLNWVRLEYFKYE
jgi:Cys-tRNA synthase (O-phospho-L-seryl-tRNA:Cys-tRNA synthase)